VAAVNKRYHDAAEVMIPEAPTVGAAMSGLFGASLVIGVGGLALLVAVERLSWPAVRVVLFVAASPWLISGGMLAWAAIRRALAVLRDALPQKETAGGDPDIRLIKVQSDGRMLTTGEEPDIPVNEKDLTTFVRTICDTGDWSQRTWDGRTLHAGKVVDKAYHHGLMCKVTMAGIVQDYGPKRRGRLAITDSDEALRRLNLI
jgi:hypothetical protein